MEILIAVGLGLLGGAVVDLGRWLEVGAGKSGFKWEKFIRSLLLGACAAFIVQQQGVTEYLALFGAGIAGEGIVGQFIGGAIARWQAQHE